MVGSLHNGQTVTLPNVGFARHSVFFFFNLLATLNMLESMVEVEKTFSACLLRIGFHDHGRVDYEASRLGV